MKRLGLVTLVLGLLLAYQNCALESSHEGDRSMLSQEKTCANVEEVTFAETYYRTFRSTTYCGSCHQGGDAGIGRAFVHPDFKTAFQKFKSLTRENIENMAVNPGHKPPSTGAHVRAVVDQFKPAWDQAEAMLNSCNPNFEVVSSAKTAPAVVYTQNPPADAAAWQRLSYDLETEVEKASLAGRIRAQVSIEVRRRVQGGATVAYEFKNPRVNIKTGGAQLTFKNLMLKINNQLISNFTLYNNVEFTTNSTTEVLLAPGVGFGAVWCPPASLACDVPGGTISNTDVFAVRFEAIRHGSGNPISDGGPGGGGGGSTLPTRVTHADLNSANPTLGVFNQRCNSCHNNTRQDGGLNLLNYNQAFQLRSTIQSRMNNTGNPMPPAGVLGAAQRQVVDIWISSGAPQN